MQGQPNPEIDLDLIISDIREAGARFSGDDAVYHDEELEFLVPAISRVFTKYAGSSNMYITRKQAMIQIFDVITRFVEDPSLIPTIDLEGIR